MKSERLSRRRRTGRDGWLLVEVVVSLAIMGMLMTALVIAQNGAAKLNKSLLARQRCLAAGQAQLDSIAATGRTISNEDIERLWPGVRLEVHTAPGKGDWEGLTRLRVVAGAVAGGRNVKVTLCRYIIAKAAQ